jgi:hypothetical protein
MIKKPVFENDLIAGMHKELVKQASGQDKENLGKAVDYLNSVIDIFEDAGMRAKADAVLKVITKIAAKGTHVKTMPSFEKLFEHGLSRKDIININKGDTRALGKLNLAMRKAGYTDDDIRGFLGDKYLPVETASRWAKEDPMGQFRGWMTDILSSPKPGEVIEISPLPATPENSPPAQELAMKSSLSFDQQLAKHKSKTDRHTQGLTSEKMLNNLKQHGTVFNMADDQNSEDLLDADIGADLEVLDKDTSIEDFEDERE